MIKLSQKIEGAIWGLLIGDALGVPYEFHQPKDIPDSSDIEFEPPSFFQRYHIGVPPATWSDDGAHALCLLASLLHCQSLDTTDLMKRLSDWYDFGYMAVDGKVFDVGIQTSNALSLFRAGVTALECGGGKESNSKGNGSLMRCLPLALWHRGSDMMLVKDAHRQSKITHGSLRVQVCCALYCLWGRRILYNISNPWYDAVNTLRQIYGEGSPEQEELEFYIRPDDDIVGEGSGYVVDSLRSAKMVLQKESYSEVVKAAISLGRDTDTTACIAGGLAGLKFGIDAIPKRWRNNLRGVEIFTPLIRELIEYISEQVA